MKFLLKQQVKKRSTLGFVLLYPGNTMLTKLANKKKVISEVKKHFDTNYNAVITDYYIIPEKAYYMLVKEYKELLNAKRNEFYAQPELIQLQQLLKYCFQRNNKAKKNKKYYSKINAYDDKAIILQMAFDIAKKINNSHFSYGYQIDDNEEYHKYIYYFQITNKQISFHSEILYEDIPVFKGKWVGYRNESYPFTKNLIKKFMEVS